MVFGKKSQRRTLVLIFLWRHCTSTLHIWSSEGNQWWAWNKTRLNCDYHLHWILEETHRMVAGQLWRQTDATQHLNSLPSLSCRCWIQPLSGLLIDRISRLISYWQKREKLRVLTLNSGLNHGFRQQPVRLVVSSVRTSLNMGKNEITWKQIFTYWSQDSVSFIMELSTLNSALHWIIWEKGRLI